MPKAEDFVKKELNIKYVGAQKLIQEAKQNLTITDNLEADERLDEIVEEAINIFEDDLTAEEQADMRIPEKKEESEFTRKAREAAEKRERKWQEEDEAKLRKEQGLEPVTPQPKSLLPEQPSEIVIEDGPKARITETTTTMIGADGEPVTRTVRTTRTTRSVKVPKNGTSAGVSCACTII